MPHRTHLLIVDAQNDFCDLPDGYLPPDPLAADGARLRPALPVAGAHADLLRLAAFIEQAAHRIDQITLTLDSHHRFGIERPAFWMRADGVAVAPFTEVSAADVRAGRCVPRRAGAAGRVLAYLDALEATGRYRLMVWPAHCEIGSWGHALHPAIARACGQWEARALRIADKVIKGANPWTEHYSAIQAEVPDPADPATQRNRALLDSLAAADLLLVAGQAGSHCVKATVEHLADHLAEQRAGAALDRLVLLTDCMSPVAGFEAQQEAFLQRMRQGGARLASAGQMLAELEAGNRLGG